MLLSILRPHPDPFPFILILIHPLRPHPERSEGSPGLHRIPACRQAGLSAHQRIGIAAQGRE
ncbi:hypothetical protein [Thermoflavifilum thermophilum]|uniref:hypothetical protein n=1 Tax=Thermoflavifilum thermophilum TaxID=1393122 RepID=UPI001160E286|nr:hypothetical protein [Thermoflavifilum thermophilum]